MKMLSIRVISLTMVVVETLSTTFYLFKWIKTNKITLSHHYLLLPIIRITTSYPCTVCHGPDNWNTIRRCYRYNNSMWHTYNHRLLHHSPCERIGRHSRIGSHNGVASDVRRMIGGVI